MGYFRVLQKVLSPLFPFIQRFRSFILNQSGMAFAIGMNFIWKTIFLHNIK